ncbi:plasma-membrane proton-efflux P-type ATPase [Gimesia fumaroli]|uniref:Calcium-transporting ATPase 1 n=1 Tax=Gimesia fumaroli TaxID=2527976 RepID=A0A518I5H4_9PLAN|nr:plasma-membrane proton-efflux P-type ATPase [Gimesia fumaroli]QDV48351.1 Calcium-transporting ATPase 1 [Gimesia fumaroli]
MSNQLDFKELSADEVVEKLQVNPSTGLMTEQIGSRQQQYGFNEIPEKEETLLSRILKRFWGPIPWMIEIAGILSAAVGKWEDFGIIMILLLVNVVIDFRQEAKAISALKLLKEKLARLALVLRDGRWSEIPARELVPGDVIKLRIGNVIPADVTLIDGAYLQVDQSALTGESVPADKMTGDIAYANSVIKMGEMVAVVTGTGLNTFFGHTVELVAQAEKHEHSHLQKAVVNIGNYLILIAGVMVVLIIFVGLNRHDSLMEILRFSLVLMVASIPVALPAVLSVTMAVGAMRLAQHQAIVSRLVAIEELAGVDILCCDKTGTLTKNQMKLEEPALLNNFTRDDALFYAALASRVENNDPLESPIFQAVQHSHIQQRLSDCEQLDFTPFDPVRKRTEATIKFGDDSSRIVTKGAPQAVLALCDDAVVEETVIRQVEQFAHNGYRTLGVGVRSPDESTFHFVGLLPFYDPPRDDSAETIATAKRLGLDVKMITGDNLAIARQIVEILGIQGEIRNHTELSEERPTELLLIADVVTETLYGRLKSDATSDEVRAVVEEVVNRLEERLRDVRPHNGFVRRHESEIVRLIEETGGFAQVFPEDKYHIVDRLQLNDHIVAMTGDGVNDAPALKKADAGIAVSGATDAARAAADIVLLLPGLSVIINAIEESRQIFGRMKSYAIFRIAETLRVILFMTLAITVFNFYPVTAIMIIILALLNDIPIMAIAYDNSKIEPHPVRWNMREVLTIASVLGLAGVVSSFLLFFILEEMQFSRGLMQAILFLKLDIAGHSTIYVARTGERHFWERPFPSLKLFIPAMSTRIVGTLIACYGIFMEPVGWKMTGYIYLYATVWFVFNDFLKVAVYRMLNRTKWLLGREHVHEIIK